MAIHFISPMNSVTIIGNFHDLFTRDANGNLKAVGERGRVNPVSVIEDFKQRQETNRVIANLGVKLKPLKASLSITHWALIITAEWNYLYASFCL